MRKPQSPKYDFICEYCSKKFHNCDRGPNYIPKFCSMECYRKSIHHTGICAKCGKEFSYELKGKSAKIPAYCSKVCWYATGKKNNVCIGCGKEFITNKSQNGMYCSRKCSDNKKDPSKKSIFTCKWCGKSFEGWTYRNPIICSSQCRSEYGASIRAKQLYKGISIQNKGMNWKSQARLARKRDKYTCQVCGLHGWAEHIPISVHHIIPYRLFNGNYEKANDLYNLVSLCPSCHPKVECGVVKLPTRCYSL